MFFSGDPSTRKRVDLRGRSSKERDPQKLLEDTRLERNRRFLIRQQNSAALKIQKCFRGRKAVEAERNNVRKEFFLKYGPYCENINRHCFAPDSNFIYQLIFFFNPRYEADCSAFVKTCRFLLEFAQDSGDIQVVFSGSDYQSSRDKVDYRVKILAQACILALYENRSSLKDQLFPIPANPLQPASVLFDSLVLLIDGKLPWACKIVCYVLERSAYSKFREMIQMAKTKLHCYKGTLISIERILALFISHVGLETCTCLNFDPGLSFSTQILVIPFLWKLLPHLKEVFGSHVGQIYVHQMAVFLKDHCKLLPNDNSGHLSRHAYLIANLLEAARISVAHPSSSTWAIDFSMIIAFLLQELSQVLNGDSRIDEDEMLVSESQDEVLDMDLKQQIFSALDPQFLQQLINVLFGVMPHGSGLQNGKPNDKEVAAVIAACSVLNVTFSILPLERIMTVLAYRTEVVPILWNFMKRCHENEMWPSLSEQSAILTTDAPGWLLPVAVFCPIYKHMLVIIDNEEFYELEKPLSLKDIQFLIVFLREVLWQILWLNPSTLPNFKMSRDSPFSLRCHPIEFLQYRVCMVASELMSQLQDWNNRREFTSPSDFNADGSKDITQATAESSRVSDILKLAPFLVPFTSRAKIFNSQLETLRKRDGAHAIFARTKFKIRRDHILEDAFSQLNALSEEDLRGVIRVTFVNELGAEEAGIDGGGIFKDFMENITRAAFDVQYGLFKETADHLLYPNPGSGLVHENHLQFFHFLGTILAKAMFEGILVDIPFATFFISKLKQKYNYLNDLPSLDPELYRHLIFLKHYKGDISQLELYFVIVNNEYGEQNEEELLPGGKSIRVTNENVIQFIHLVANHRLNFQIRQQSAHFLRGFQQLIQKDWIDMFNEQEFQLLISGSVDEFDVDDLREHTNYTGGYHPDHYVITMFWKVIQNLGLENQRKFMKFATGCSRGPLLGFKYLEPRFCIQRTAGEASEQALDRLPTSATCMNLLKLPPYASKEQMEHKLVYAINSTTGFDLS